jgi:hypothetical protein
MVAPTIEDGIYSPNIRGCLQTELDKNYHTIDLRSGGEYPIELGVEAAQLKDGFAYLETIVLSSEQPFQKVYDTAVNMFGIHNIRLTQPIPDRAGKDKPIFNSIAVYVRYSSSVKKADKKEPKKRLNIVKSQ